jgi:ABC-2 type transport system ATP-binding protein
MTPDSVPAVEALGVGYRYGARTALREVGFEVARGEIFGFLGPNGGGKSTLFRILATLLPPLEGTVRILGHDATGDRTAIRREIGVVFQAPSLDRFLTARENLLHQGHLYGLRGRELGARIEEMLERFQLLDRSRERVDGFSGGMRRRLEIAKALLHRPRLLILDEPSTGLDPSARRSVWKLLRELQARDGLTVALTTHLMEEAETCGRLAILDQGRRVALDTPEALKQEVGGDVVTAETEDPDALAADVRERFGVEATVAGGRVRVERPRGHEFVATMAEAFPGRIRSVAVGRPTLEDVFVHLTGRELSEADAEAAARPETPAGARKRKRRRS